jgi:hypothetical protein
VRKAGVTIAFDSELVEYVRFEPQQDDPAAPVAIAVVSPGRLTIELESERPLSVRRHLDGIRVGEVVWRCTGPGRSCLYTSGRMSPEDEPVGMCPDQKATELICFCVAVIYRQSDTTALAKGSQAALQVGRAIGSNFVRCCPAARVKIKPHAIREGDWRYSIMQILGADGAVSDQDEYDNLINYLKTNYNEPKCINFVMVNSNWDRVAGQVDEFGPSPGTNASGYAVIDPDKVDDVGNIGAHEAGHLLGLRHVDDPGSVMLRKPPLGNAFSRRECARIYDNRFLYNNC